jgi:hypothetical protein
MAQGLKGDWLFNGGFKANHYEGKDAKSIRVIEYDVQVGSYIKNGLCVGAIFQNNYGLNAYTESSYGVLPFVRAGIIKRSVRPFAQLEAGRIWHKFKFQSYIPGDKYHETNLNFRLGVEILLSENTVFEIQFKDNLLRKVDYGFGAFEDNEGLSIEFGISWYLRRNRLFDNGFSLKESYLKKGNTSLFTDSDIGLKKNETLTSISFSWGKMLRDNLFLKTGYRGQFGNDPTGYKMINIISPSVQYFAEIKENTFFSPSIGTSLILAKPAGSNNYERPFSLFVRPSITHFFKKAMLDISLEGRYYSQMNIETLNSEVGHWAVKSVLGVEYYLAPQLAIRGELWGSLLGPAQKFESFYIFSPEVGNAHFRFGFHYFYQKKKNIHN